MNSADFTAGADASWAALLWQAHRQYALQPAVRWPGGGWSWDEVMTHARGVAAWLHHLGVRKGDRVVIALENRPEVVCIERALALWGAVRVATGARLHPHEISYIAQDCNARVTIVENRLLPSLNVPGAIIAAEPCAEAAYSLPELFSTAPLPCPPTPKIVGSDLCSLMYTSGTTGRPKGAMNSHRAWHAMATQLRALLPSPGPGDVLLHAAPMSHFSGSVAAGYIAAGAALATLRQWQPAQLAADADAVGATCVPLVPTMLHDLLDALRHGAPAPQLRVLPYGGSPVSARLLTEAHARLGAVLQQFYGASEALIPLTSLSIAEHTINDARLTSAGQPHAGVEIMLLTPRDSGGEICVRGANVMLGYWNNPAATAAAIDAEGWYHTGDIGRFDAQGRLHIVGRQREMLISGGFNIYPAELERVIANLPGVAKVCVLGIPHPRWGEAVKAIIVPEPGYCLSEEEIINGCTAELARYKKPQQIEFVSELPLTGTGKVDKVRLLARENASHSELQEKER
ncbi:AMP-dependent synthetase and ligase [Paramixta manurensis]|uniref:AMP-dependent synthetase and ligase n=2 Tax=Paramixta manurensis TaxID=2740817 RepID=A0A6M8UGA7_9GAMM|nr:AMP-dependent synthetase and ligase [Erwiniaceae bacterium PD-1]